MSGYAAYDAGNYSPRLLKFSDVQEVKILLMLFDALRSWSSCVSFKVMMFDMSVTVISATREVVKVTPE